jgi:hypothetical protein
MDPVGSRQYSMASFYQHGSEPSGPVKSINIQLPQQLLRFQEGISELKCFTLCSSTHNMGEEDLIKSILTFRIRCTIYRTTRIVEE